jgi:hypothetical protein
LSPEESGTLGNQFSLLDRFWITAHLEATHQEATKSSSRIGPASRIGLPHASVYRRPPFGPEGNTGELRYRLSQRIAYFVSDDPNEIKPLATQLRKAYDMRSKVVHGRWGGEPEIDKIILETERIGRRVLLKILRDPNLIRIFSAKGSIRDDYLEDLVFPHGSSGPPPDQPSID